MKMSRYIKGCGVKKVTHLPNFVLKILGRMDARKGEEVVDAQIKHYLEKCGKIESKECLLVEELLKDTRSEGATTLEVIKASKEEIADNTDSKKGELTGSDGGNHTWQIYNNRKRASSKYREKESVKTAKLKLVELNQEIIYGHGKLRDRVNTLRKNTSASVLVYIKGVRLGGISSFDSFNPDTGFSEEIVDSYIERHKSLDDAISAAVAAITEETNQKED